MEKASTTEIICPRCGYDLRGAVQTWTDACPLAGRCAECGLEFSWREVLLEATHPRLFEHQWRRRPIRSLIWTLWTVLRPWRFWREVRLVNRVRLRPALVVVLAAAALLLALVYGQGLGWAYLSEFRWATAPPVAGVAARGANTVLAADPYLDWIPAGFEGTRGRWGWSLTGPLQSPATAPFGVIWEEARFALGEYPAAFAVPLLMPLAFALIPLSLIEAKVRPVHVLRVAVYSLVYVLAWVLLWTFASFATFFLLHLTRAEWFEGAGLLTGILFWGDNSWGWNNHLYSGDPWDRDHFILLAAMSPLTLWWGFACSRYLKLRHPWWVAVALSVVVVLVAILLHVSLSLW